MTSEDLDRPPEVPRDLVEIRQEASITVQEALTIAATEQLAIGKSTIQRWAKRWADQASASPVKSVLVTTRDGKFYYLDRDDFTSWLIVEKNNARPNKVLQDPMKSQEVPRDTARPHQTPKDPQRPFETSRDSSDTPADDHDQLTKLRSENMNLKIDLEVRKQLLDKAGDEITRHRDRIENLLINTGLLQSQILQLGGPASGSRGGSHEQRQASERSEGQGTQTALSGNVDNTVL